MEPAVLRVQRVRFNAHQSLGGHVTEGDTACAYRRDHVPSRETLNLASRVTNAIQTAPLVGGCFLCYAFNVVMLGLSLTHLW